jgi:hypothetical protein
MIMLAIARETATMGTFAVAPMVHTPTITTLYSLIETLQDQVVPADDSVVTAAVVRLCKAGYAKFLNVSEASPGDDLSCFHI